MVSKITSKDLENLLDSKEVFALIDVRERNEYENGQILGAAQISRSLLEFRMPIIVPIKKTKIVLYSNSEKRALLAAKTLEKNGYSNVYYLEGGLNSWKKEGRPIVEGTHVISKAFGEIVGELRDMMVKILPEELKSWMDNNENYIVIEVRPPEEVAKTGSIPGAINIQGVELPIKIGDYIEEGRKIVVTCAGHTRGYIATATLNLMGIKDVYDLKCGTLGWQLAGFDLEDGIPQGPQPSMASRKAADLFAKNLVDKHNIPLISVEELQEKLDNPGEVPTYLLDVRSLEEYELIGHIPNSIAIPGGQAIQNTDDVVPVHGANIIFVCDNGTRSAITAYWYKEMGFENVYVLDGGLNAWTDCGKKLKRGKPQIIPLGFEEANAIVEKIDPVSLSKMLDENSELTIIDVGSSRTFKSGHIPGAHWIIRGRLEERINQFVPNKETTIVISCPDGLNSIYAAATLKELGYKRVFALSGGNKAWKDNGFQLIEGLEGIEPDDWFVYLTEYKNEDAKKYFAWEDSLIHLPEYMEYFRKRGVL